MPTAGGLAVAPPDLPAPGPPPSTANRLVNPGFEDADAVGWSVENLAGADPAYVYDVTPDGGGHGDATPRTGARAIEVYTSERVSRISQRVAVDPGTYRVSVWARINGASALPQLRLSLGTKSLTVPVMSLEYREYFADFDVRAAGPVVVALESRAGGIALDDARCAVVAAGEPHPPHLFVDLTPTNRERSAGVQAYLVGESQFVDLAFSTMAPGRLRRPVLRLAVPEGVVVSGFNDELLDRWRFPGKGPVHTTEMRNDGARRTTVHEIALPRFVKGPESAVEFGGFWVTVPSGAESSVLAEVLDAGEVVSRQIIRLVPVAAPKRLRRPRRLEVVVYDVQDWKMSWPERLAALPRQFAMLGGTVWSDYTALLDEGPTPTADDLVRDRAAREHGVTRFWPNSSQLFEAPAPVQERETNADGLTDPARVSLRYAAQRGAAWTGGPLRAIQRTLDRPRTLGLAFRYTGFITDGLEAVRPSYDESTLRVFAAAEGLPSVASAALVASGSLRQHWQSFNLALYTRAAENLAEAIRSVDPLAAVVNTAGPYGPSGAADLGLKEQASWSRAYTYTMPQWYATGYYGKHNHRELVRGIGEGIYGRRSGHADVIPLFNLSAGRALEQPQNLRFRAFDLTSTSDVVKGIGYYRGVSAFADATTLVGLSEISTLLADVEDYYVLGQPGDGATFEPSRRTFPAKVDTTVRVHRLGIGGRKVLLTVLSHSDRGGGESGTLRMDLDRLGADRARDVLVDHLGKTTTSLAAAVELDTSRTGSMALLEIMRAP